MKPVLSVLLLFLLVIVAVHHTSASSFAYKKRFYDNWDSTNDLINDNHENAGSYQSFPYSQRNHRKEDPCTNKPLWYLKYQARLGKLSPFYDCLSVHGI